MDPPSDLLIAWELSAVAGLSLFGALVILLQRARKKWSWVNLRLVVVAALTGALMIWALVVLPLLKGFDPVVEIPEPKRHYVSVSADTPVVPQRTTFTREELDTARRIADTWSISAAVLFFGGLVLSIYGAVRGWRLDRLWIVTTVGMVGAYIIWDFVIISALESYQRGIYRQALPKGFGDQPGVVAAFVCAFVWAFILDCVASTVRTLRRVWSSPAAGPTGQT